MAKKSKPSCRKNRNLHACHPIMRKGGVHEKSQSAKRAKAKRATRQATAEWHGQSLVGQPLPKRTAA